MRTVGAYEAKTHLPRLLEEVRRGGRITITRRGQPIAELVPAGDAGKRLAAEVVADIKRVRAGMRLDGLSVRELIDEGRR